MDPTPTTSPTNNNCNTPDTENETPPAPPPPPPPPSSSPPHKPLLQFTNGALKNQSQGQSQSQNQKHLHHLFNLPPPPIPSSGASIPYKECLKNHAAAMGGHAVDGCGEFMPAPTFDPTDPTSFKCAACGCHRNFHRRDDDYPPTSNLSLEFHHRYPALLPPPPPPPRRSSPYSSPSPPPPHPSCYGSAPNMLLALSTAVAAEEHPGLTPVTPTAAKSENPSGRKRFRTRFSTEQKEKMRCFSEKLGWKMQRSDEGRVQEFCNEIGVRRGVLKVWMHNNKNTFGRKETINTTNNNNRVPIFDSNGLNNNNSNNNSPKSNSNINGQEEHNNGVHHPHVSSSGSPSSA